MKKKVLVLFSVCGLFLIFMISMYSGTVSAFSHHNPNSVIDISGLSNKQAIVMVEKEIANILQNMKLEFAFEQQVFVLEGRSLTPKDAEIVVKDAKDEAFGKGFFNKLNIFKNRAKKVVINKADLFFGTENFVENVVLK